MKTINDFMNEAYELAKIASELGEVPIGAVVVNNGKVISRSHNLVETNNNATMHAEILAINSAMVILGTKRLSGCDLYVTMEPCTMCAGAIAHARLDKVIFGCYDPKGGGVEHGVKVFNQSTIHHIPEIIGGVKEKKCDDIIKNFFVNKR